jgi:hypothetical protein
MYQTLRVARSRCWILIAVLLVFQFCACSEDKGVGPDGGTPGPVGWFWQNPLPQGGSLGGTWFTDTNTGTAVGTHGTILRTVNGGEL